MVHIGIELTLWAVFQRNENPVYVSCILKECSDLYTGLIPVLLLGSMSIGKRCFGSRNNSTISNPFADGFLLSREISKVSFELPEGFSKAFRLLPKSGSSKVCFELLKTFRVTPKTLPPGCLSEVVQPVFSYILITKIHLGMALSDLLLMQPASRNKILNVILHDSAIVITLI